MREFNSNSALGHTYQLFRLIEDQLKPEEVKLKVDLMENYVCHYKWEVSIPRGRSLFTLCGALSRGGRGHATPQDYDHPVRREIP